MEPVVMFFMALGAVVYLVICAICAWLIAEEKGRPAWEGFFYGAMFGPLGVLIEACLPNRSNGQ